MRFTTWHNCKKLKNSSQLIEVMAYLENYMTIYAALSSWMRIEIFVTLWNDMQHLWHMYVWRLMSYMTVLYIVFVFNYKDDFNFH